MTFLKLFLTRRILINNNIRYCLSTSSIESIPNSTNSVGSFYNNLLFKGRQVLRTYIMINN